MKVGVGKFRGFTIVEILVTIALLGIIIVSTGQFFSFNLRTYLKGEQLAQVQFDVRMASDFITSELRNVTAISNNVITDGSEINVNILQERFPKVTSVKFSIIQENLRYLVEYEVSGNSIDGKNLFVLESKVLLNNDSKFASILSPISDFDTIFYK